MKWIYSVGVPAQQDYYHLKLETMLAFNLKQIEQTNHEPLHLLFEEIF
jgi:hypothetical protein